MVVERLTPSSKHRTLRSAMAVSVKEFTGLIGAIIHDCGALEMYTDNAIKGLGRDPVLSGKIIEKLGFSDRIKLLRDLLYKRTKLPRRDVDSLCHELLKIAEVRNKVAHNSIVCDDEKGSNPHILVVRHKSDTPKIEKLAETDLRNLLKRVTVAVDRFTQLVPESTQI